MILTNVEVRSLVLHKVAAIIRRSKTNQMVGNRLFSNAVTYVQPLVMMGCIRSMLNKFFFISKFLAMKQQRTARKMRKESSVWKK